jgi:hypothetical protein
MEKIISIMNKISLLIILSLILVSCSSEWHMKRALKKNPKLADSSVKYVPYYKDTVVTIQIVGDTSDQSIKFAEWYKKIADSTMIVFSDSFTHVTQELDSLGKLKTKVVRLPYEVKHLVTIHDTIQVKLPPQVIVKKEIGGFTWVLILIAIILFLLLLNKLLR